MRLTLRTMLAFMDDVLEGPDAKALGQKIDESKFASDLVHRIRSSVRRLRLGAPKVDGKGMGAEANTVAEYLDNTMPAEQVPEFEKVCLESDVQLAEVAACHQILTIVLGEPATVEAATRDRMYRIGHLEAAPALSAPQAAPLAAPLATSQTASQNGNGAASSRTAAAGAAAAEPQPVSSKEAHVEPDSLTVQPARHSRPSTVRANSVLPWRSLAITLLLGFVVAGVALRAIHPLDANHPLWRVFSGQNGTPELAQQPVAVPVRPAEQPATEAGATAAANVAVKPNGKASTEKTAEQSASKESVAAAAVESASPTPKPTTTVRPVTPDSTSPSPSPVESTEVPPAKPVTADAPVATTGAPTVGAPTVPVSPVTKPVLESNGPMKQSGVVNAPVNVGRYISDEQVLARLDSTKNAWMALPSNSSLVEGEQILSLPTYRPQVLIAPNVKMTLAGEAFVKLHAPEAGNIPRVSIDFGRATLVPIGEMGNVVQIDFAGRSGQLVFADLDSSVALEVRPYLPPGADPVSDAANIVVQMWVLSGGAEWREPEKVPLTLLAGQRGQFLDEAPVTIVPGEGLPDWVEGKNLTDIERRASQELRKFLTEDRPLALSLMEQTNYRQVEVRALACRCLCYMDIFEPAISALGDSQHRSYWHSQMAAIQSTMAFGPATVEKLRTDVDRLHSQDTETILRLLRGYSPEQLASGGAAELVDALENKSMTIRVLAFLTLHQITDKTQLFRPEDRPEQEKSRVTKWRKMLEDGQIVYKSPPTPLPLVVPATPDESAK